MTGVKDLFVLVVLIILLLFIMSNYAEIGSLQEKVDRFSQYGIDNQPPRYHKGDTFVSDSDEVFKLISWEKNGDFYRWRVEITYGETKAAAWTDEFWLNQMEMIRRPHED